jgi:hypothetical protein
MPHCSPSHDAQDHTASSSSSSSGREAQRVNGPRLPSFSSEDEGCSSQRAVRDGFVLEPNGSFETGLFSFDHGPPPPDLVNRFNSSGSPSSAAGSSSSSCSGSHDNGGSGLNVMMVYPPMQLYHGLFGRALPDSTWPSDHCLVTAAIALEPEPPFSRGETSAGPLIRLASTNGSNGD